jgi:hypothetical protein
VPSIDVADELVVYLGRAFEISKGDIKALHEQFRDELRPTAVVMVLLMRSSAGHRNHQGSYGVPGTHSVSLFTELVSAPCRRWFGDA